MSKTLFILNDPPYGSERSYNALRLAATLARAEGEEVRLFLDRVTRSEGLVGDKALVF